MDEIEAAGSGAAPLIGDQTSAAGLIPPNEAELQRRADLQAFVGPNHETFFSIFDQGNFRGSRKGCWPGFFFPLAWFMYRKMYGWAALVCALPIFASVLDFGLFQRPLIAASSFLGLAGRHIYVLQAQRTVARIRAVGRFQSEEEVRRTLARAGGVSTAGAAVGGAIAFCGFVVGVIAGYHAQHH
jgi:hypothetical protein